MTGYASTQRMAPSPEGTDTSSDPTGPRLGVEIRSVNSRFLDLSFRLSDDLRSHEPALRQALAAKLRRGKVELRAFVEVPAGSAVGVPHVSELQRLGMLQTHVQSWLPDARGLSVADVLRLSTSGAPRSVDWTMPLAACVEDALGGLLDARESEGARLAQMLLSHLQSIAALVETARPLVPKLVEQQRQRFIDRWNDALGQVDASLTPQSVHERALAEAAAYAIRIDVGEELVRLSSHVDELRTLLRKGGEIGKRLDFLIQELHREANTLGSKSSSIELTRISVDMKVLIEQMREQVQNLE